VSRCRTSRCLRLGDGMSLNWNVTDVPDSVVWQTSVETEQPGDQWFKSEGGVWTRMNPTTDLLIWKTMSVDLGSIEEANLDEWLFRLKVLQGLNGPDGTVWEDGERAPWNLSMQDLVDHIGLRTNVARKTTLQWVKSIHPMYVKTKAGGFQEPRFTGAAARALVKAQEAVAEGSV